MDSDVSPVSESDVLEGSVSSTVAGGGGATKATDPRLRNKAS